MEKSNTLAKDIASHLLKIQAVYLKPEESSLKYSVSSRFIQITDDACLSRDCTLIENGFRNNKSGILRGRSDCRNDDWVGIPWCHYS